MNVLVVGNPKEKLLQAVTKSKILDKLYTAGDEPLDSVPNIEYKDFDDLADKALALQIDVILTADKTLIEAGIADCLKKRKLNIIAANKKWFHLESSGFAANQLLNYYSINTPTIIKAPLAFPIVIKSSEKTLIAKTMNDLITKRESLEGQNVYLEEYLDGKISHILFIWDGKNLLDVTPLQTPTEVQLDRFELLKTKLNFMLSDENADFTGFFTLRLVWSKNDWYILDFFMYPNEKTDLNLIKKDFLFIINSAIYQKLNEL